MTFAKVSHGELFAEGAPRPLCRGARVIRCIRLRKIWADDVAILYCRGSKPNSYVPVIHLATRRGALRAPARESAVILKFFRQYVAGARGCPFERQQLLNLPPGDELAQGNKFVNRIPRLEFCASLGKPPARAPDMNSADQCPKACKLFFAQGSLQHTSEMLTNSDKVAQKPATKQTAVGEAAVCLGTRSFNPVSSGAVGTDVARGRSPAGDGAEDGGAKQGSGPDGDGANGLSAQRFKAPQSISPNKALRSWATCTSLARLRLRQELPHKPHTQTHKKNPDCLSHGDGAKGCSFTPKLIPAASVSCHQATLTCDATRPASMRATSVQGNVEILHANSDDWALSPPAFSPPPDLRAANGEMGFVGGDPPVLLNTGEAGSSRDEVRLTAVAPAHPSATVPSGRGRLPTSS